MAADFRAHPYQELAVEWMLNNERCALWAGMGMGKTVSSLNMLDACFNVLGEDRPALVLGPQRVARGVWTREQKKWNHLAGLEVVPIIGNEKQRLAALRADAPIKTINYENLPWLVDQCKSARKWPWDKVIADESTRLKNFRLKQGGARAQALGQVAHTRHVRRWVNLTGTPAPNGLVDLWGQTWFLDQGERLGLSFSAFESRWFAWQRNPHASGAERHEITRIILPYAEEQIHARLDDICLTLDPKDWFDLQDPIEREVLVELPAKARRMYREMEREMFTTLSDGESVEAAARGAAVMKCMQIANGCVYHDQSDRDPAKAAVVHGAKLEALESIISEANGMPVLVSYFFKTDLRMLKQHFKQGVEFTDDQQVEDDWNAGKIPLMFIHPQSAGHGLDLQHGSNILVFYSDWWDAEAHAQVIERIGPMRQLQAGYDRPVFIYYLVAEGTVDHALRARYSGKMSTQGALMDYMNRTRRGLT